METYVLTELRIMVMSVIVGVICGIVYVITSLFRAAIKAGTVITALTDVLFGILTAIAIFVFTFLFNNGILRAYIICSMLFGFSLPLISYRKIRYLIKTRHSSPKERIGDSYLYKDKQPEE